MGVGGGGGGRGCKGCWDAEEGQLLSGRSEGADETALSFGVVCLDIGCLHYAML